jgi:hypothetical protein
MATRIVVSTTPNQNQSAHVLHTWSGLLNADDGSPVDVSLFRGATLQVTGVFGAGGSMAMDGSNDGGATWFPLNADSGTPAPIAVTAAGSAVLQTTALRQVRPRVTAGDGTTNLVARLYAARL